MYSVKYSIGYTIQLLHLAQKHNILEDTLHSATHKFLRAAQGALKLLIFYMLPLIDLEEWGNHFKSEKRVSQVHTHMVVC